jgi:hypothetical protein
MILRRVEHHARCAKSQISLGPSNNRGSLLRMFPEDAVVLFDERKLAAKELSEKNQLNPNQRRETRRAVECS